MANANETSLVCAKCGLHPSRLDPWGKLDDLCEACEKARIAETNRIAEHYENHPDECCCDTYLYRDCCMAPIHGDVYEALCIENGERFYTDLRAASREEAEQLSQEIAAGWGGECISVRKVPSPRTA
jgi:hypothetical protein